MVSIYKISIKGYDKVYIGSTKNYTQRKYQHIDYSKHYYNPNHQLYYIIREYGGWDNCVMEIIEENSNVEREQYWIDFYQNTFNIRNPIGMKDEEKKIRRNINAKTFYDKLKNDTERYEKKKEYAREYMKKYNKNRYKNNILTES